jgi:hypothetical protein
MIGSSTYAEIEAGAITSIPVLADRGRIRFPACYQ